MTADRQYADDDVLEAEDVASYLRVSPQTVYKRFNLAQSDPEHIPYVGVGRRKVVPFWMLREWMARKAGVALPATRAAQLQH